MATGDVIVTVERPVEPLALTESLVSAEEEAIHEALLRHLLVRVEPGKRLLLDSEGHDLRWMERLVAERLIDGIAEPSARPTLEERLFRLRTPRLDGDQVVVRVDLVVGPGPYPERGSYKSTTEYRLVRTADGWVVVRFWIESVT